MRTLMIFNNQIESLFEDLIKVSCNMSINKEISMTYEKFKLLRKANADKSFLYFTQYILPYKQNIISRDENFFLGMEVDVDAKFDIVGMLKNCWTTLTDDNKDVIWRYFYVLIQLCEKIIKEKC